MFKTIIALLVLSAGACQASFVQASVTCTVGAVTISDPSSCQMSSSGAVTGIAQADVSYSSGVPCALCFVGNTNSGGDYFAFSGLASATSDGITHVGASTNLIFDTTLTTSGPLRTGWLSVFFVDAIELQNATVTVDGYPVTPTLYSLRGDVPRWCQLVNGDAVCSPDYMVVPIVLGAPFDIDIVASAVCPLPFDCGFTGQGFGFDGGVSLHLNEVTTDGGVGAPAQVLVVNPEPSTCLLMACGALLVAAKRWRSGPISRLWP